MREALIGQLIRDEGFRVHPYMDSVGKLTIGVGHNLSDVGLTQTQVLDILNRDIDEVLTDLSTFAWFPRLDATRQCVMANMRFNLGSVRFRGFKRMLAAMAESDYGAAADSMRKSVWARQVGARADRLIAMMRSGLDT